MTKRTVSRGPSVAKTRNDRPVKREIVRAAKRIGHKSARPIPPRPSAPTDPDEPSTVTFERAQAEWAAKEAELEALRQVVDAAAHTFDSGEEVPGTNSSMKVLREGLRAATADFELLAALAGTGSTPDYADFYRAESRARLALEIADYRARFGGAS